MKKCVTLFVYGLEILDWLHKNIELRIPRIRFESEFLLLLLQMFHHVSRTGAFQDWLKTAVDLNPKYDYFNFANTVMKDKATTGSLYITIMNDTLQNAPKKKKPAIIDAIVLFNVKINIISLS